MSRWLVVGAFAAVVVLLGPGRGPTPVTGAAEAGTPPAGFVETTAFSGLTNPMAIRFASDGRVFVAEKSGLIKVFASPQATTPTVVADLRTNVYNFWDRGLLGFVLHPNFPAVPYVYVLYAYDHILGDPNPAPKWGTAGATADSCPNPPGATSLGCVVSGRLSRLQISGNAMVGSEQVLVEDWCQQFPSHSVGALEFGPDGMLYASGGDGASFNYVDYGQTGNPCGDPPGGTNPTPPTAEGGALRAQDLRTPADPAGLNGTIIRVNPTTGAAAAGNPQAGSADANVRRVIAYGLRNPFRFGFRPGTNEIWIGDVGSSEYEEIDRITNPTAGVVNFGWPCYEGNQRHPGFEATGLAICQSLYADPNADTKPFFQYRHTDNVVAGESCPTGSSSVSGIAFEFAPTGGSFPAAYNGALFFSDYSRKCIWVMKKGNGNVPAPGLIETFVTAASNPVNLEFGPDGSLYYPDFDGGTIKKIAWGSAPPTGTTYQAPVNYPTGTNAHGVVIANLNGDGKLDLAVANAGASTVSVLLGNGDGTFGAATSVAVGSLPKSVAASDFNGDGNVDLVTANQGSHNVTVLLGNGNGTFAPAVSYPACTAAHEVAIGQFNGDGDPDLAVACWNGSVVGVLLGAANGTFGASTTFTSGAAPHSIVARDFTGDGKDDLAVANRSDNNVSVLVGSGTGSFGSPTTYPVGAGPHSLRTGDFDGDGYLDIVTANDTASTVSILRGSANGTFAAAASFATGSVPKGIAVGDLNGDRKLDVVTANTAGRYPTGAPNPGGDQVSVLLGTGSGSFGAPTAYQAGNTPFAVGIARLDGDGTPDLVTANWFGNDVAVLRSSSASPPPPPAGTQYLSDLAWTSATNGWGPVERNMSNGESAAGDGRTITLNGVTYTRGLGVHSLSDVRFALAGCSRFKASVGVDDETGTGGTVTFQVWAGATMAYDSGAMNATTATKQVDVSIANATQLRLVTTDAGDGVRLDHGDWADARIECGADTIAPTVSQQTPTGGATGVATSTTATATFSEDVVGVTGTTFTLLRQGQTTPLTATVTYTNRVATLTPGAPLESGVTYTATLKGGAGAITDVAGNPLAADVSWSFTTSATPPPGGTQYLSDLSWTSSTNGWGPVEKDKSNGESGAGDGRTITLNGVTYTKGLGVHAASEIVYGLSGCSRFRAAVGVDDESGSNGSLTFQAWVDGVKLYDSGLMNGTTATKLIDLSLTGASQLRLVVTDGGNGVGYDHGDWADARIDCGAATAPEPTIVSPASSLTWKVGDVIAFSGSATDPQDGALPASALSWALIMNHCPSNCHTHTIQTWSGVASGSFTAPDHEYPSYLELRLTATDSSGATATKSIALNPQTVTLSFASSPAGLTLSVNGTNSTTPFTRTVISGSSNSLSAPSPQTLSAVSYGFSSWSDGGAQTHNVTANANASYTATFTTGGTSDTTPPTVTSQSPSSAATGVSTGTSVSATFSEPVSGVSGTTFTLVRQVDGVAVPATVSYASNVATLVPSAALGAGLTYTATVKGGSTGVKDLAGLPLAADVVWSFTTATVPPPTGTQYLSDLTWTSATNGWGPVEKDKSNGEKAAGDGRTITLNGTTYTKGLGVHAASDVRFALSGCSRFKADVGVDDEVGTKGSVSFQVFLGATKIYDSGLMTATTATKSIDVSIAGGTELRLVVTDGGLNGVNSDHADWAVARIECP